MVYLLTSISPEAVRVYFDGLFPPANLLVDLHKKKKALQNLKCQRILNSSQWALLYPTSKLFKISYVNNRMLICSCLILVSIEQNMCHLLSIVQSTLSNLNEPYLDKPFHFSDAQSQYD